jgi:transposase-like protein
MTTQNLTLTDRQGQTALIDSSDFVKGIVKTTLQELLEAEMTAHLGAEAYERAGDRTGYRNGHRPRTLNLTVGRIELRLPQDRDGSFDTELFGRYQRSERAFTLAVVEMWVNGVSNRKVAAITEELCDVTFSKSQVSELCRSLDAQVSAWKSRDFSAHVYPYVFVDALYEDVRAGNTVTSKGVLIVTGVREDGRREVLDATVADTESAATYNELFGSLRERGLRGVRLVTSDAHAGLKAAIGRYFQGVAWQRCQVHFLRDVSGKVSLRDRKDICEGVKAVFSRPDKKTAMAKAAQVAAKWRDVAPRAADMIEYDIEQCLSALAFPEEHQVHIRTNNAMERLNREIRRRDRVIGVFPNEASATRLICTLCIEQSEEWLNGRPWLEMGLLE